MSWTARNAFAHFSDQQIDDLYGYLKAHFSADAEQDRTPAH